MPCELEAIPEAILCVEATSTSVVELVLVDGHADATESQPCYTQVNNTAYLVGVKALQQNSLKAAFR